MTRHAAFLTSLLLAGLMAAGGARANDLIRIGADVSISEPTHGSLAAVGGMVAVDAPVDKDLRVAGGDVEVGPDAAVGGNALVAGGDVTVKGPVRGYLRVAGGEVKLDGPVAGNVSVAAGSLTLGPDARIAGKLDFRGGELNRDPAAQVTGGIQHVQRHGMEHHEATLAERYSRGWTWTAVLLVLAALVAGGLPGPSQRLAQELLERPWLSALLGFLTITAVPVAAVLLVCTIIGIPIAIAGMLLYVLLLLTGYVWLAVVLGGLILDRVNAETAALTAWRVGAAVLTMLVIAIMARLPYVGGVLKLSALVVGVGMIVGAVFRARQTRTSVAPT